LEFARWNIQTSDLDIEMRLTRCTAVQKGVLVG